MGARKARFTLFVVMLVTLMGTIGIALPYPVLAPYFIDYLANGLTHFGGFHPKVLLGIALAVYPLGLLIGSTFIGALSDTYGRKKMLLLTLLGSVLGYVFTAWSIYIESYPVFILARWLTGVCEGNIAIARALATETEPHVDRTQALSLVNAASYTGWLVGPLVGALLMQFGVAEVFLVAAIGMFVTVILTVFSISPDEAVTSEHKNPWLAIQKNNSLALLKHRPILPLFWFYFMYSMGLNAFYDFYPVWFVDYHQADAQLIAQATICLTAVMILVSTTSVNKAQKRWGEVRGMLTGATLLALLLAIQPFAGLLTTLVIFGLIGGAIALTNGMVPSFLSRCFGELGQGRVMGLQTCTFCITNVIIAVVGGPLSILDSRLILLLGAGMVMLAVLHLWRARHSQQDLLNQVLT